MLADKFERFRNILMDGLRHHSDVPLANLDLAAGCKVLDMACGWGETALRAELARYAADNGEIIIDSSSWTIIARCPDG